MINFNKYIDLFKGKTLLITGGTGSFGSTLLRFLNSHIDEFKEIRVFSRDEKKQHDLRVEFMNPKLKFIIGDVRDKDATRSVTKGVNFIFHAAALKQVPSCEFFPLEAVKTNILGTDNLIESAIENNVEKVICLSTDKAAYPINSMGISKALMEKIAVSKTRESSKTKICITRYGNVMASRGSVIPVFIDQILNNKPLTITDGEMTRFLMSLDEAVELVLFAFKEGETGDLLIQKSPASTINTLAEAIKTIFKYTKDNKSIGIRHGEKMYETLATKEEISKSIDLGNYYKIPSDYRDLNYNNYYINGEEKNSIIDEYNSSNTTQLGVQDVIDKLLTLDYVQKFL